MDGWYYSLHKCVLKGLELHNKLTAILNFINYMSTNFSTTMFMESRFNIFENYFRMVFDNVFSALFYDTTWVSEMFLVTFAHKFLECFLLCIYIQNKL